MSKEIMDEIRSIFKGSEQFNFFNENYHREIVLKSIEEAIEKTTPEYKLGRIIKDLTETRDWITREIKILKKLNTTKEKMR